MSEPPSPSTAQNRPRAAALALVVTFLWSTSWVLIRRGLDDEDLPPITFAGLRYALAAVLLVAWTASGPRRAELRTLERRTLGPLVALGVVMYAITQGAQFVAIEAQPFATTNLMLAMTPLVVALTAATFVGETTTIVQRIGGLVIVAGVVAYFRGDLGATRVGMTAATIGLIANAASVFLGRSINRATALSSRLVTTVSMSVGAVLLLSTGLVIDGVPRLGWVAVVIIVWLAAVNTAVAFTWWNQSQRVLSATETAAINTAMAVQIPIFGWIFFDEALGPAEVAGITLVVLGVLAMRSTQRRAAPPAVAETVS